MNTHVGRVATLLVFLALFFTIPAGMAGAGTEDTTRGSLTEQEMKEIQAAEDEMVGAELIAPDIEDMADAGKEIKIIKFGMTHDDDDSDWKGRIFPIPPQYYDEPEKYLEKLIQQDESDGERDIPWDSAFQSWVMEGNYLCIVKHNGTEILYSIYDVRDYHGPYEDVVMSEGSILKVVKYYLDGVGEVLGLSCIGWGRDANDTVQAYEQGASDQAAIDAAFYEPIINNMQELADFMSSIGENKALDNALIINVSYMKQYINELNTDYDLIKADLDSIIAELDGLRRELSLKKDAPESEIISKAIEAVSSSNTKDARITTLEGYLDGLLNIMPDADNYDDLQSAVGWRVIYANNYLSFFKGRSEEEVLQNLSLVENMSRELQAKYGMTPEQYYQHLQDNDLPPLDPEQQEADELSTNWYYVFGGAFITAIVFGMIGYLAGLRSPRKPPMSDTP